MLVLDMHILVWWFNCDRLLSEKTKKAIANTLNNCGEVIISSISAWEITMLIQKGRLLLNMDVESWLYKVVKLKVLP